MSVASQEKWNNRIPFIALLLMFSYLISHLVLRLLDGYVLGPDETEQALFSQQWQLTYHSLQPPLYTWLQLAFNEIFGVHVFSFVLLRYVLQGVLLQQYYCLARDVGLDRQSAFLASASLLLLGPVAWGAHFGFTHSLLMSVFCILLFRLVIKTHSVSWLAALLAAILATMVLMSKLNGVLFLLALGLAIWSLPVKRQLWLAKLPVVLMLVLLMFVPLMLSWWNADLQHRLYSTAVFGSESLSHFEKMLKAGVELPEALLEFLSPFWILIFIFRGKREMFKKQAVDIHSALLDRFHLAAAGLLCLLVLLGITRLDGRWLHPLLLFVPLWFFMRLPAFKRSVGRRYTVTLASVVLLVIVARLLQVFYLPLMGQYTTFQAPYREVASEIRALGFDRGLIITAGDRLGGNLRLAFEGSPVVSRVFSGFRAIGSDRAGSCLLIREIKSPYGQLTELEAMMEAVNPACSRADAIKGQMAVPYAFGQRLLELEYVFWPEVAKQVK